MFKSFSKMKYESNLINTSLFKSFQPLQQYLLPKTYDINNLKIELLNKNKDINNLKIELENKNKDINNLRIKLLNKNKDINNLKIKLENNETNKCSICLDNSISHCCIPCGHTYCHDCIKKTNNCYICSSIIRNKIKLYL